MLGLPIATHDVLLNSLESSYESPFQCVLGYHLQNFPWDSSTSDVPRVFPMSGSVVSKKCGAGCKCGWVLPRVYWICPTFHVSLLKPIKYSRSHPHADVPTPPPCPLQDGSTVLQVRFLLDSRHCAGCLYYWWMRKVSAQKNGPGC